MKNIIKKQKKYSIDISNKDKNLYFYTLIKRYYENYISLGKEEAINEVITKIIKLDENKIVRLSKNICNILGISGKKIKKNLSYDLGIEIIDCFLSSIYFTSDGIEILDCIDENIINILSRKD